MKIVTGSTGSTHVTSNNDGEFNQALFGNGLIVFENGAALDAIIVDNNTIRVSDGDLVLQGRHALIEPNTTEDITIETGAVGVNRNDLIVARYVLDTATGYEDITLEVLKGAETSGTAVDPEITTGDIRTGSKLVEAALYRVKIEGINIVSLEKLFTVTENLIDMIIGLQEENSRLNSKSIKWELVGSATGANSISLSGIANMTPLLVVIRVDDNTYYRISSVMYYNSSYTAPVSTSGRYEDDLLYARYKLSTASMILTEAYFNDTDVTSTTKINVYKLAWA